MTEFTEQKKEDKIVHKNVINKAVHTFKNGVTLVYARQTIDSTTEATIGFRCGSQCDGDQHGLAHLLEHMLFMGLDKEKQNKYFKLAKQTDTYENAATSFDYISTDFNCPNSNLETIIKMESDILLGKKQFDPKVLENEKKVVLHEYDGRYDSETIAANIAELTGENYEELILKHNIKDEYAMIHDRLIGTPETLSTITPETLQNFIDKYFVSENMVISIVSSLPYEYIRSLVYQYYVSQVKSNPKNKVMPAKFFNTTFIRKNKLVQRHVENALEFDCKVFFKTPKYSPQDTKLFKFVDNFLFNEFSGLLMQELRLKKGLTYTSFMRSISFNDEGNKIKRFDILTNPENAVEAIKIFTTTLGKLVENGITQEDLDSFKLQMISKKERKSYVLDNSSERLFQKVIKGKEPFQKTAQMDFENLTVEKVNQYLKNTYGYSKVGIIFDGDLNKAQHVLTQEQLTAVVEAIYSEPAGTNYEGLLKDCLKEYQSHIIALPSLEEMTADFNLSQKALKKVQDQVIMQFPHALSASKKFTNSNKKHIANAYKTIKVDNSEEELSF